jgi:cell division protease FtsH
VTVGSPDVKGRERILGIHAEESALDTDIDLRQIARGSPASRAPVRQPGQRGGAVHVRGGREIVTNLDFDQARDRC